MKAWGSGDEKVVAKKFELLFNASRSEDEAKDRELPRRWQNKSTLGSGVGGGLSSRSSSPTSPKVSLRLGTSTQ